MTTSKKSEFDFKIALSIWFSMLWRFFVGEWIFAGCFREAWQIFGPQGTPPVWMSGLYVAGLILISAVVGLFSLKLALSKTHNGSRIVLEPVVASGNSGAAIHA